MRRTIQRPSSVRRPSTPVAAPVASVSSAPVVEAPAIETAKAIVEQSISAPRVTSPLTVVEVLPSAEVSKGETSPEELTKSERSFAEAFEAAGVKSKAIAAEWAAQHPELFPERHYTHYAHRSGHETYWACPRKYYLEYKHCGTGIRRIPTKLALSVGSAVHIGLAFLLQAHKMNGQITPDGVMEGVVDAALLTFRQSDSYRFLKEEERQEQDVLIAGLLYSFFYYRWPSFSKQFEVLTAEQDWVESHEVTESVRLVISSRPDAIVRDRNTNEIVAISWKTIDDLADFKRANFHQNLQTFLEAYYGQKVLRRYLDEEYTPQVPDGLRGKALMEYLAAESQRYATLSTKVDYTLTIFLVKGPRTAKLLNGDDISLEDSVNYSDQEREYKQNSFLCYRWVSAESTLTARAWTTRYWKDGNASYNKLPVSEFVSEPIQLDEVEEWVKCLAQGDVFPSTQSDTRNLANPLSKVVIDEEPEYFEEEAAQSVVASFVNEEEDIARRADYMHDQSVSTDLLIHLDQTFPKHLISCNNSAPAAGFPVKCEYKGICHGNEGLIQIADGKDFEGVWARRVPHHNAELERWEEKA